MTSSLGIFPPERQGLTLILFFLSGFAGLIYEVVWTKTLSLTFGTTTTAAAIVISAFMAGLGVGGIYWGKKADHTNNPIRLFGRLELGISISSFIVLIIFKSLSLIYKAIYQSINVGAGFTIFLMFILAFVVMFIPTFLMGGTFPVISKAYIKHREEIGKGIGMLYAMNTFGGIIGAGFAGYFALGQWGQNLTQIIAIVVNLIVGVNAFFLTRQKTVFKSEQVNTCPRKSRKLHFILFVAGLTGFMGLAYEIFWIRALSIFLANSTYTFAIVLIIFLLGITIGSFIFTKFLEQKGSPLILLALCQTCIGSYIIITASFLNKLPGVLFALSDILEIPIFRIILPGAVLGSIIMLIPTIFMGISFPLICKIYNKSTDELGKGIGLVYFLNTAGSIIGPLVAGFVFLPLLGVVKSIIVIAVVNLCIGIVLIIIEPQSKIRKRLLVIDFSAIAATIIFALVGVKGSMLLPPSIFRTPTRSDKVLSYRETKEGTVVVSEDRFTSIRVCYINNSAVIGTTYDALKVVKMLGHLPFWVNPEAEDALVIGFGIGITTSAIAQHNVKRIDCVEICPGVREAAKYFANFNNHIFRNPKVNFITGDGRNYLLLTDKKYDVISCDPTHPTLGSGSLYTLEYFKLCKAHLNKNGVVCQYLPFHKLSLDEFKALIKTFAEVFPHTTIWLAHSHGILVGTDKKLALDFEFLKENLEKIEDDILNDSYLLISSLMLDEEGVKKFTQGARINTDNHPYLEFFKPNSLKRENWEINIYALLKFSADINLSIINIEDREKLMRYLSGQRHFITGLVYKNKGDKQNVIKAYNKALEINPENNEIKIFLQNEMRKF